MADDPNAAPPPAAAVPPSETKPCPYCGEEIKKVAVRCKHCQADLSKPVDADFKGAQPSAAKTMDEFEVRFLEFAYQTTATLNVTAVAHALRMPTGQVSDRLEDMAARDVIGRDVDDDGNVFFTIHGRKLEHAPAHPPLATTSAPGQLQHISAPADGTAVAALVLNIVVPGVGSLVAGRTSIGVAQLVLWVVAIPLCVVLIGFPMLLGAWIWSLVSGIQILEESRRRQSAS